MAILAVVLYKQLSRRLLHCNADSMLISGEKDRLVVSRGNRKVQNYIYTLDQQLLRIETTVISYNVVNRAAVYREIRLRRAAARPYQLRLDLSPAEYVM